MSGGCDAVYASIEVVGFTDSDALNFMVGATGDEYSCIEVVNGCGDTTACNFNPMANTDDRSCYFDSYTGCLSPSDCN